MLGSLVSEGNVPDAAAEIQLAANYVAGSPDWVTRRLEVLADIAEFRAIPGHTRRIRSTARPSRKLLLSCGTIGRTRDTFPYRQNVATGSWLSGDIVRERAT